MWQNDLLISGYEEGEYIGRYHVPEIVYVRFDSDKIRVFDKDYQTRLDDSLPNNTILFIDNISATFYFEKRRRLMVFRDWISGLCTYITCPQCRCVKPMFDQTRITVEHKMIMVDITDHLTKFTLNIPSERFECGVKFICSRSHPFWIIIIESENYVDVQYMIRSS